MNTNVVILKGRSKKPMQSIRHYFRLSLQCGEEQISVNIPKKLYRQLPEKEKKALSEDEYPNIQVEGYIKCGSEIADEGEYRIGIITDSLQKIHESETENLIVLSGIVCQINPEKKSIKIGVLEGRHWIVVSGTMGWENQNYSLTEGRPVMLTGKISSGEVIFTDCKPLIEGV